MPEPRSGGRLVVAQLEVEGVRTAYCVPGESYLEVLDALHDSPIRLVVARQEGGAGYMADAHARVTGEVGVCLVTRGPGAANAMVAVHTAWQDSVPLVLLVGLIPRGETRRESFQEFDLDGWFGTTTKATLTIDDAARVPEQLARAFALARTGRPGPVVVGLPEDMLRDRVVAEPAPSIRTARSGVSAETVQHLHGLLARAHRPLVVLGGGGWTAGSRTQLQAWAERHELPVAVDFNCLDLIDHDSPSYVGPLGYGRSRENADALREADLLIGIGSPLGDVVTDGWDLVPVRGHPAEIVVVLPDSDALGSAHPAALRVVSDVPGLADALDDMKPDGTPAWSARTAELRAAHELRSTPSPVDRPLDLAAVFGHLRAVLPDDAIVTWGAGNHGGWATRYLRFGPYRSHLAPRNGSMGYGVPAAVAAAIARPDRRVVSIAGDGCFLMNGQELATATAEGVAPVVIVLNNSMYGTIRTHQEIHHPGRVSGTALSNPDFAGYARDFGGHGEVVSTTAEFAPALRRAFDSGLPAVVELRIDPDVLGPDTTLADLRTTKECI